MKLDIWNIPGKHLHEPPRGCMNDFCLNKEQIIIKMQTANICYYCLRKIQTENISDAVIQQITTIFNEIRNEFVFHVPQPKVVQMPVIIENNGKIIIAANHIEIKMTPLYKTLYIFYLQHENGVSLIDLSNYKHELLSIYRKLRPSASGQDAGKRIDDLIHPLGTSFNSVKSRINSIILQSVPTALAPFYQIGGSRGEPYRINIPRHLVDIRL
jgi:hypothetical protein